MTPDQLASEELSEWREKTMKKELDMIKEVAIEAVQMSSSGTIRKMTYKGEVEIERPTEVSDCIMCHQVHTHVHVHVHKHIMHMHMYIYMHMYNH